MAINTYTTTQGDRWDSIAYKLWGAEHHMHLLLAANPAHADVQVFSGGVVLVVPAAPPRGTVATIKTEAAPWRK